VHRVREAGHPEGKIPERREEGDGEDADRAT
jgi:hypothetical protein